MELVDIPDLKSGGRMAVGVRVPPPAPRAEYLSISQFLGRNGNLNLHSLEFSENGVRIPLVHWEGPHNTAPVFHWAHATGFNGETYRTLLEPIE